LVSRKAHAVKIDLRLRNTVRELLNFAGGAVAGDVARKLINLFRYSRVLVNRRA